MGKKLLLILTTNFLFAHQNYELNTIEVNANTIDPREKKIGKTLKSNQILSKEQVADSKDLVKYETGVSVVESGRFGTSG